MATTVAQGLYAEGAEASGRATHPRFADPKEIAPFEDGTGGLTPPARPGARHFSVAPPSDGFSTGAASSLLHSLQPQ